MSEIMRGKTYDWASFAVANGLTDYDVKANVAALFNNVPYAKNVVMFFNKEIGVRFNSTVQPKATMGISRSPFQSPNFFVEVKNLFITNASGAEATIEVWLW